MPLTDHTSEIQHTTTSVDETISSARATVEGTKSSGMAGGFSGLFGGSPVGGGGGADFAGMSEAGKESFKDALNKYIDGVQEVLDKFSSQQDAIDASYKGEVNNAVVGYLESSKAICQAYIMSLKREAAEIDEAYANWQAASGGVASDISGDSDTIRGASDSIQVA